MPCKEIKRAEVSPRTSLGVPALAQPQRCGHVPSLGIWSLRSKASLRAAGMDDERLQYPQTESKRYREKNKCAASPKTLKKLESL